MGLLEFLSKATDNEHCTHTSAYPNRAVYNEIKINFNTQ